MPEARPTREELIAVATHLHDESGCGCDPEYLMSWHHAVPYWLAAADSYMAVVTKSGRHRA